MLSHHNSFIISNASCSGSSTHEQLEELDDSNSDRIVTKTCTLEPLNPCGFQSNKKYYYDGYGAVNAIGLINKGFNYYKDLQFSKFYTISIAGSVNELNKMMSLPSTADLFELNISCPNINVGGFGGRSEENQYAAINDLHKLNTSKKDIGLKLPPLNSIEKIKTYCDIINCAKEFDELSIKYIVCCNTISRGILDGVEGSLSGKYLQPLALWNVREFRKYLIPEIDIFGCGGISSLKDIQKYINVGAAGVQIATEFIDKGTSIFQFDTQCNRSKL